MASLCGRRLYYTINFVAGLAIFLYVPSTLKAVSSSSVSATLASVMTKASWAG